jgi:hypothetical protein
MRQLSAGETFAIAGKTCERRGCEQPPYDLGDHKQSVAWLLKTLLVPSSGTQCRIRNLVAHDHERPGPALFWTKRGRIFRRYLLVAADVGFELFELVVVAELDDELAAAAGVVGDFDLHA